MSLNANLPGARQPLVDAGGVPSRPFYVFFQSVATTLQSLSEQIGNVTTTPTESPISENANVVGSYSIYTQGVLKAGIVRVLLQGDVQTPGNTQYYGSDGTGERGWYAISDALDSTANITLTVGTDGVTTLDLANLANSGTGAALVKITRDAKGRVSGTSAATTDDLTEGTTNLYYTDARASAAAPVQSVNGATGVVVLGASDVGAATTAQGALADSAVQPGDNVSGLTNDAGYLTDAPSDGTIYGRKDGAWALVPGGAGTVDSVNGQTGTVVLDASDVGLGDVDNTSDADKPVSTAQQAALDALVPPGYIDGLQMKWVSGTAVTVTSGAAYIEGSGKVLRATADIAKTGLSLTASTWYHVYLYSNAGTPDIELSTTVPTSPYNGTARSKAGDSSRRYVGSARTDTSGNILSFYHEAAIGEVHYRTDLNTTAQKLVINGTSATEATVSAATAVPVTSRLMWAFCENTDSGNGIIYMSNADAGSPPNSYILFFLRGLRTVFGAVQLTSSQTFTYVASDTATFQCYCSGYRFER